MPPYDIQTCSKDPNKPPFYKDYIKGTKKTYISITSPKAHLGTSPCRPNPRVYMETGLKTSVQ